MTDQEMLQAIGEVIDKKLEEQKKETLYDLTTLIDSKLDKQRGDLDVRFRVLQKGIMHDVTVLMDADFGPRFKLLSEQMDILSERMDRIENKIDRIEEKVTDHEIKLKIVE